MGGKKGFYCGLLFASVVRCPVVHMGEVLYRMIVQASSGEKSQLHGTEV